jgi:hypothetical protein
LVGNTIAFSENDFLNFVSILITRVREYPLRLAPILTQAQEAVGKLEPREFSSIIRDSDPTALKDDFGCLDEHSPV